MPTDTESHKNKTHTKTQIHRHKIQGTNIQNTENRKRCPCKKILNERNSGMPLPTEKSDTKKLNTFGISLFIQRY